MNSRADLLRTLAYTEQALGTEALLEDGRLFGLARLLGFEIADAPSDGHTGSHTHLPQDQADSSSDNSPDGLLSTARHHTSIWYVHHCEHMEAEEEDGNGSVPLPAPHQPETEPGGYLPVPPLRNPGQWQNLWDRVIIGHARGRRVDLRRCLRTLSQARPLGRLPLMPRRHFNGPLVVIMDRPSRLAPAFDDMLAAWLSLRALVGRQGLSGYLLRRGPGGPWETLDSTLSIADENRIKPGAQIVLIGAFGALEGGHMSADWRALIQRLQRRSHPLHLLPLCPLHDPLVTQSPLDPRQGRSSPVELARSVTALLAALSQTWKTDSDQLRYLRHHALPDADLHAELLVANDQQIGDPEIHFDLHPDHLLKQLRALKAIDYETRERLRQSVEKWRRSRNPRASEMERLQSGLLSNPEPEAFPRLLNLLNAAGGGLAEPPADVMAGVRPYLPLLNLLSTQSRDPRWLPVFRRARRVAIALGEPLPGGYHPGELSALDEPRPRWVYQTGRGLAIRRQPERGLLMVGANPYAETTGKIIKRVVPTDPAGTFIRDRDWRYELRSQSIPAWADRMWQDKTGLIHAAHPEQALFVLEPATLNQPDVHWRLLKNPWPWATDVGVDQHGLWAEFTIKKARQRMRWIAPGSFLMGAGRGEPEGWTDETQHPVTLTRGYWLADSATTQALWQAVTGNNPAHFKNDPRCPVEQVSWDACRDFIAAANGYLGADGPVLRLPTEAEWEYACRADSKGPFSWGDTLSTKQANYNGGRPYPGGDEGENRRRTLPVHSFEPNPWGLYQMHGNVREWCADWLDDYPKGEAIDPAGPAKGHERVLRGGCWSDFGRILRSAYRVADTPDSRFRDFGLRLAGGSDPHASQQGARPRSADRSEWSERRRGAQGAGGGSDRGDN